MAVVNNVEADHLECYGSLEALEQAFVTFAGRAGRILIGADDEGAGRVAAQLPRERIWRFGLGTADLRLSAIEQSPTGSRASLSLPDRPSVTLRLQVPGVHNLRNAAGALVIAGIVGADSKIAAAALAAFSGLPHRLEFVGEVCGVRCFNDSKATTPEAAMTSLAAFEGAPCYRELLERERREGP